MRLTPIFNAINEILSIEKSIKLITWYNQQEEIGTIHTMPAVLVEFPEPLQCQQMQGQFQQAELTVRLHLVSKIHATQDGNIPYLLVKAHEDVAQLIYHRVHLHKIIVQNTYKGMITNTLTRTSCQFLTTPNGFAITIQDFQSMVYQHPVFELGTINPTVEITTTIQ